MFCPDEKKEVEVSEGSPQVTRLRMDGSILRATIEFSDLCSECYRQLQAVKMDVMRDLKDTPALYRHLEHKLLAQTYSAERLHETPGFASVKISYGIDCECGKLPTHDGEIFGTAKLVPTP